MYVNTKDTQRTYINAINIETEYIYAVDMQHKTQIQHIHL